MPNSALLLDVKPENVTAELQWPLNEFQLAVPNEDIQANPTTLINRKSKWLDAYLHDHMTVTDMEGHAWKVMIISKQVKESKQDMTGVFRKVVFQLILQPPAGASTRHFIIHYDAIMHQLVTHKMLITLRQDWDGGLSGKDSVDADLGVLMMNTSDNKIPPLVINLDEGSKWKGFKNMVSLGIRHIGEGTDHLLFLLVLMLPAPLIALNKKWTISSGTKYAVIRLLKIATTFTVGHSITLLAGAIGWFRLPAQPVEILIAISILIGAIHALRPLFPGKEFFVAAGFGLIHGLAFAATLANLNLDGGRMALSILGFNVGIEIMQLFVLVLFVPWLIILSNYKIYSWIRIGSASFALIAAIAWIFERILNTPNKVAQIAQDVVLRGQWIVLAFAVISIISYFTVKKRANI